MRKALLWCCLVTALCVASLFGQQPDPPAKGRGGQGKGGRGKVEGGRGFAFAAPASPKWEYAVRMHADIQEMGDGDIQRGMNKLGESGWELVSLDGTFGTGRGHAYFKRPKGANSPRAGFDFSGEEGPFFPMVVGNGRVPPGPQAKETTTLISLKNSQVNSMAQMIQAIYGRPGIRIVPDSRTNRLVLLAPEDQVAEIRRLIDELDQPAPMDRKMVK
jgi:hypothetical protein